MTRVLLLAQRTPLPDGEVSPHGSSAHVAATLAALRMRFDVAALGAKSGRPAQPVSARMRSFFPLRVRGLRRDLAFAHEDRAYFERALALVRSFRPDVVYERDEYFARTGERLARRLDIPLVLEVNGLLARDAQTMYRSLAEPVGSLLERRKLRRADAIVTVSPGLADALATRGAPRSRLFVVPNSVSAERVVPEPRPPREGPVAIGFLGHLMAWHADALLRLVDVAPALVAEADVRFVVIGDGPRLPEIREHARAAGVDERFEFVGSVPYDDVPRALAQLDIGVIPEIFDYAFPVKLVDYGAAGLPVVAPRSTSLDRLLAPGVEYLPFEPGRLGQALLELARDPELRTSLGVSLHRAVRERYTWTATADRLEAVVRGVLR